MPCLTKYCSLYEEQLDQKGHEQEWAETDVFKLLQKRMEKKQLGKKSFLEKSLKLLRKEKKQLMEDEEDHRSRGERMKQQALDLRKKYENDFFGKLMGNPQMQKMFNDMDIIKEKGTSPSPQPKQIAVHAPTAGSSVGSFIKSKSIRTGTFSIRRRPTTTKSKFHS